MQREQRSSCCSSCPWQLTEGFGAQVFMRISGVICYAPYFIHFLFQRSLHDNQWGIVGFICFSQTLADNHVNVPDDISVHFISVCVYICAFVSLCRENCISIGNQLSTLSEKTNCAVGEKGVYTSVCVTGPRPLPYTICLSHVKLSATVAYYLCVYPPDVSICQRIRECVSYLCHDSMMITGNWYFAFIIMRLLNLFSLLTCIINVQFYH